MLPNQETNAIVVCGRTQEARHDANVPLIIQSIIKGGAVLPSQPATVGLQEPRPGALVERRIRPARSRGA